jgi:hypothetical protein
LKNIKTKKGCPFETAPLFIKTLFQDPHYAINVIIATKLAS